MRTTAAALLLLLPCLATAASTTLRGTSSLKNPFTCSLSAFDEDTCKNTQDDDGQPCEWCELSSGAGLCLSESQYQAMGDVCQNHGSDDDVTPSDDDAPTPDDDFWSCLESMDEKSCHCTWCTTKAGFGLCFNDEQVKTVENDTWYDCSGHHAVEEFVENPLDPQCLAAGMGNDDDAQSVCDATLDSEGTPCVWCDVAGIYGLCLSHDAADSAGQYLECDNKELEEEDSVDVPADFWDCLKNMDENDCDCTWCTTEAGFGVCLADAAAKAVEDCTWFDCDDGTVEDDDTAMLMSFDVDNPIDPQCLAAGMGSDDAQSVCDATLDSEGSPCVWCDVAGSGFGVCLSQDAADAAGQYLQCDKPDEIEGIQPLDPQCLTAGMNGGDNAQQVCDETLDSTGSPCVWCDAAGVFGLCLSSETAEAAGKYLQCDTPSGEETPIIPDSVWECLKYTSEETCKDECTWCNTMVGIGMCFSEEAMEIAKQYEPLFDCDSTAHDVVESSPLDPTCITAGFNGDDAEATCHETQDEDGTPCVWCEGPSPNMGVCLSSDQADMASQWLTCDNTMMELEEAVEMA